MISKNKLRKMIDNKDPKALPHLLEELRKRPRIKVNTKYKLVK